MIALLESAMRRFADRIAVIDERGQLTFRALDEESAQLASAIDRATEARTPLVIDVPRGTSQVVAVVAAIRAGRAAVPVDRSQPTIPAIIEGSGASHAIVTRDESLAVEPLADGRRGIEYDNTLLYILFTSGSTGTPKGVAMGPGPVEHLARWHLATEELRQHPPRTAQFAPLTFDVAWQELVTSLAMGGELVVVPDGIRSDPDELLRWLATHRITRLFLPTAYLPTVAERGLRANHELTLERVFVAGSRLRITSEMRAWFSGLKDCVLENHYGPAETHVVTYHRLDGPPSGWPSTPPIGVPLPHVRVRVEEDGELLLAGDCLCVGYHLRPDLTDERFIRTLDGRAYRTGDRVRSDDGLLWFEGRVDRQLKIDGHRVEPSEAETLILEHPEVGGAFVAGEVDDRGRTRLVAYFVPVDARPAPGAVFRVLHPPARATLLRRLPGAAVPTVWLAVAELPLNPNGKVDGVQLAAMPRKREALPAGYQPPSTPTERRVADVWTRELAVVEIGRDESFFDLGGTSLLAASVTAEVANATGIELPVIAIYRSPTVRALAAEIDGQRTNQHRRAPVNAAEAVAVVGMACRFPGAGDAAALWRVLSDARETITRAAPVEGRIRAAGVLPDVDQFDAGYFGLGAGDARACDPQQRLFLECCVEAMEDAGCVPERVGRSIGVFAGSGPSTYLLGHLADELGSPNLTSSIEDFLILMGNDKEFLPSRAAYALDLRGPSVNVNAACATALFAVHYAIDALRRGACDVALAGAASIQLPQLYGYHYAPALPLSPDGRCRAFDRDAAGTVFSNGVGVIALKRLTAAMADRDDIYAVIRGSGISNDGADKVGFTAPSVSGQVRAIQLALDDAGVPAASIRYVEGHGTATQVGDAVEVEALRRVFGTLRAGTVGLGSVKTNLGHLGWAAGMAGLMKAVLALRHRRVPESLHCVEPNPELRLAHTPFHVVREPLRLETPDARVGVSAFGVGGFNAHVILEAAPERSPRKSAPGRSWFMLPFSARSETACQRSISAHRDRPLAPADLARTLALGRIHHPWRRALVVNSRVPLAESLASTHAHGGRVINAKVRSSVGIFAGHGAERRGMAEALYATEPLFRDHLHRFDDLLRPEIGHTVAELLYPNDSRNRLSDPVQIHAIVFAVQVALYEMWRSKGLEIEILLGHSLGQYAAAYAAGVFTAEDGMTVVLERGRAISDADRRGTMASVRAPASAVRACLVANSLPIDLAVINGPANTVISGLEEDLRAFAKAVPSLEVKMLGSLRAGHSRLMAPVAPRLVQAFASIELRPPTRQLLCNLTGELVGDNAANPIYWGEHLCQTVQFGPAVEAAGRLGAGAFIELGGAPGLLALASSVLPAHEGPWIPVLRKNMDAEQSLSRALGAAWEAGLPVDFDAVLGTEGDHAHAPTYPFERRRHWVGPEPVWQPDLKRWRYEVQWRPVGRTSVSTEPLVVLRLDENTVAGGDPLITLRGTIERLLKRLPALTANPGPRLCLVTRGAHQVDPEDSVSPEQRALWGFGRVLNLEHPELRTLLVDVDSHDFDVRSLAGLPDQELVVRRGQISSARLVPALVRECPQPEMDPDAPYVVVGGLSGLGLWTAERLAELGARRLLLAGRRPPSATARPRVARLVANGAEVISLDVRDGTAVDALFAEHAIAGVIHSAGVLNDTLLDGATWDSFAEVLGAKVQGSINLHHAAERYDRKLAFFVMFSSASAVHGNYGQAAYATANAFLHGLACSRKSFGLAGVSIAWGAMGGVGRVSEDPTLRSELARRGFGTVDLNTAKRALLFALTDPSPEVLVLPNEWPTFLDRQHLVGHSLYAELASPNASSRVRTLRQDLAATSPDARAECLATHILQLVGRYVDSRRPISKTQPLLELGLDSLSLIQLRNELQTQLETSLPPRLIERHPTAERLAAHLVAERLGPTPRPFAPPPSNSAPAGLSLEQRRWLRLTRDHGYGKRVVPVIFHDRLDTEAFAQALAWVVSRHEVLRLIYPEGKRATQISVEAAMPQGLFASTTVPDALRAVAAATPDPAHAPSWTLRAVSVDDERYVVVVGGQHLEFDGPGLGVFVDELRRAYRALRQSGATPSAPMPIPYSSYAADQERYLTEEIRRDRDYFGGLFQGVPGPTRLPGHDGALRTSVYPARRYTAAVPLTDTRTCRFAAERAKVRPFSIILAAYGRLLAEIIETPTVCVSVIRSGRTERRFTGTIGPFTMPFPVPVHVQGFAPRALVEQVDATLAALSDRPRYPSTDLLTHSRAFNGLPIDTYFSDAGINFLSYRRPDSDTEPQVEVIEVLGDVQHPLLGDYDFGALPRVPGIHLVVAERGDALLGHYWYQVHRFDESIVAAWAKKHRRILAEFIESCSSGGAE